MNAQRFLPLAAVVAALLSAPAFAQSSAASSAPAPAQGAPARHHNPMRVALGTLDLSDDQRAQLKNVFEQAKAARQNGQPVSHADLLKQVNGVLTPTQRAQFQAAFDKAKADLKQDAPPQQ